MTKVQFRNFQTGDAPAMVDIQSRCLEIIPDTGKFELGFWISPRFEGGKNIIIVEAADTQIMGYAAISSEYYSNTLEARVFWFDLRIDPNFDKYTGIKDNLLDKIIQRGIFRLNLLAGEVLVGLSN